MLDDAIKQFPSKAAFCRACNMKPQLLTQIQSGKIKITPRYVLAIEKATGGKITRQQLRPDIYPD